MLHDQTRARRENLEKRARLSACRAGVRQVYLKNWTGREKLIRSLKNSLEYDRDFYALAASLVWPNPIEITNLISAVPSCFSSMNKNECDKWGL